MDTLFSKRFAAKATASKDPDKRGQFEALVSVTGNKDSQGDIIEPGAFTKTLAEWIIKSRPMPVVWAHQFSNPFMILGEYISQEETDAGLHVVGQLELAWPEAQRVYELMEKELIVEFSISGRVRDFEYIEDDDEDSWWPGMKIKDIDLWEAGPCFKGANPETELLGLKNLTAAAGTAERIRKEGRILAQKYVDNLTIARDQINSVLDAVAGDDSEKTQGPNVTLFGKGEENPNLTPAVRAALAFLQ